MSDPHFSCPSCGKRFRWKPALAGRRAACKCGHAFAVPDTEPGAADGTGTIPLADDAGVPTPSTGTRKCVNCNAPLSGAGVFCVRCGTDQRSGQQQTTATLPPEAGADLGELEANDRFDAVSGEVPRNVGDSERDAYRSGGMVALELGLWCELLSIVLTVLGMVGLVVAAFTLDASEFASWELGVVVATAGLSIAAYVLMLAVPGEARARWLMVVALGLVGGELVISLTAGDQWLWSTIAAVLGFLSTVFFLAFLRELANFFEFQEIIDKADKVLILFVFLSLTQFIFWLPMLGLFLLVIMVMYIGFAIYAFVLYVTLLVDLINSARYRRQHGGPIDGMIRG